MDEIALWTSLSSRLDIGTVNVQLCGMECCYYLCNVKLYNDCANCVGCNKVFCTKNNHIRQVYGNAYGDDDCAYFCVKCRKIN